MPLYADRVSSALAARVFDFQQAQVGLQNNFETVQRALVQFERLSLAQVEAAVAHLASPGAVPTIEQDECPSLIIPFEQDWPHHRAAREWAANRLLGVTTFAADGSQISPQKDLSIPVGLVQIGWFENHHDPAGSYIKDVSVIVLTPSDLSQHESGFGERMVEWHRFQGETQRIQQFMEANAGKPAVAFFDGSMVISFVAQLPPEWQTRYTNAIRQMLIASEQTHVPLVGYVDTSYANDLVTLLAHTAGLPLNLPISDAALLRPRMSWGERTRVYQCRRDDSVLEKDFYREICFAYLKTTQDNIPARVEFPSWVLESSQHWWLLDIIRAECVVGLGYPYCLETADAVAVLSVEDRQRFYRLFQDFASREALELRFSRKATSKRERRI